VLIEVEGASQLFLIIVDNAVVIHKIREHIKPFKAMDFFMQSDKST